MLKRTITFLPLLLLVLASFYFRYTPCDTPIPFSIGTIDSRFHVTAEDLIIDTKKASDIWSNTQGKQLFVYKPGSDFTINMVYDSRQALTSKITKLNTDLKQQQGEIDPKIMAFKQKQADFEKRVNALNDSISYWNSRGGAPKEEFDKLNSEQKSLQDEADELNNTARALGQQAQEYNLNADKLNQTIGNYQQVLQNKPEEGLYEQDGYKRKISIYIDISKDEFLHTLAHEMGHALGLNHTENEQSIMYPQTTTVLAPSAEDIAQLSAICEKRTIAEVVYNRIIESIKIIQERLRDSNSS